MSNPNPPVPTIGDPLWGEQMNALLADLQGRVSALEVGADPALAVRVGVLEDEVRDLDARLDVLEALPPPLSAVSTATVSSITPNSGGFRGGTAVTIVGTGFNTFGAYDASLGSIGTWFPMADFVVVDDNTITATTGVTADGPGAYQLAIFLNAAEAVVVPNAFTYT